MAEQVTHVGLNEVFPGNIISAFLGQPALAAAANIVAGIQITNGAQAIAAQPDTPRNVVLALANADTDITGGLVTVNGQDTSGNPISDVLTLTAIANPSLTTKNIYAKIISVVVSGIVGTPDAADLLTVGTGTVIGLSSPIIKTTAVKHVYLGNVRIAAPVIAAGVSQSGVDVSASTYDGAKILRVLVDQDS